MAALFQNSGVMGKTTPALFRHQQPPRVQPAAEVAPVVKQEQQQQQPPKEQEVKRKRKRDEAEDEDVPAKTMKLEKTPEKKKGEKEEEDNGEDIASILKQFHQTSKAMLKTFRTIGKGLHEKTSKFKERKPAKRKGGLDRADLVVSEYAKIWARITEWGQMKPVYRERMLELLKTHLTPEQEELRVKLAGLFMECMADEALMVALHVDPECILFVTKVLEHFATLPERTA